jgi:hypothetical protein
MRKLIAVKYVTSRIARRTSEYISVFKQRVALLFSNVLFALDFG